MIDVIGGMGWRAKNRKGFKGGQDRRTSSEQRSRRRGQEPNIQPWSITLSYCRIEEIQVAVLKGDGKPKTKKIKNNVAGCRRFLCDLKENRVIEMEPR